MLIKIQVDKFKKANPNRQIQEENLISKTVKIAWKMKVANNN